MAYELDVFEDEGITPELIDVLVREHEEHVVGRMERLWGYYSNTENGSTRAYQERGLPARLRGGRRRDSDDRHGAPERVIENDIAWRIDAMVDFVFGKPASVQSLARDKEKRVLIERVADAVLEASGGIGLLQDMLLLGSVHGSVDLVVRTEGVFEGAGARRDWSGASVDEIVELARSIRIELVEAPRAIPVVDPGDYRVVRAYMIRSLQQTNDVLDTGVVRRLLGEVRRRGDGRRRRVRDVLEILSAGSRQVYHDGKIVSENDERTGVLPVVHIQNASQPFAYHGLSDVEPLIPVQDELNTRLSDRAHRVTMQSFKMYLAKGIEGFGEVAVGPGQVWSTGNPDAEVESFGGDGHSPSEDAHIGDVRDAMDKISSISPVALGVIRAKLGHLSSENALRITLMGVLSKTARKRVSYGRGVVAALEIVLRALDASGVLATTSSERGLRIEWPDPLPLDERDRLNAAKQKLEIGVARERVLGELGYAASDPGVI
jgi:hypothetical protein